MDSHFALGYSSVVDSEDSEVEECCGDWGALSAHAVSDTGRTGRGAGPYPGGATVGVNNGDGENDGEVGTYGEVGTCDDGGN